MASSIIHYAITSELIKRRHFKDPDRLKLGAVLPDAGYNGNSHLKISICGGHRKTFDLNSFRKEYGELLFRDDLYLGYYLHLVQDVVHRHFVYDKYHWNPLVPGSVEKLHKDYAIGNYYVIQKYALKNDLVIPGDFEKESINRICAYDFDKLVCDMDNYFIPIPDEDIFFFTKEMTDEYITEAVEACVRELENLEKYNRGTDGYTVAWENARKSILEGTMNTRDLGLYRIGGMDRYTIPDRIYRSDRCEILNQHDKELLLSRGITTVVDLRCESETSKAPSAFAEDTDFEFYNFPVIEGENPPKSLEDVPDSYMKIAASAAMKDVFATIADAPGGVLYNCTAGKDRTGVVSAVLLALAGVSDEDIIYDYCISREFNNVRLEKFLKDHPEIDREVVMANEKSMVGFLKMFRAKYISAEKYLLKLGLEDASVKKLKAKLTDAE